MKTQEQSDENFRVAVHELGHHEMCAGFDIASLPIVFNESEKYAQREGETVVGECQMDDFKDATLFQKSAIGWAGYLAEHLCGVQHPLNRNPFPLEKFCLKNFFLAAEAALEKVFSESDQRLICSYKNRWVSFKAAYKRLCKMKMKILRLARHKQFTSAGEIRRTTEAKWAGIPRPQSLPATHADFVRIVCGNDSQLWERYIISRAQYHLCGGAVENFEDTKKSMLGHFLGGVTDELRARHAGKTDAEIAGVLFDENFASIPKLQRRIYGGDFPDADSWFAAARDFLNWAAGERDAVSGNSDLQHRETNRRIPIVG